MQFSQAYVPLSHIVITAAVLFCFVLSYLDNVALRGRVLDFYHGFLFFNIILPLFLVSLFAYNPKNIDAVGSAFAGTLAEMPTAFGVTALGSIIVLIVSSKWTDGFLPRRYAFNQVHARMMAQVLSPRPLMIIAIFVCLGAAAVEGFAIVQMGGSIFNLRGTALLNERLRPLFSLFVISLGPLILFATLAAWLQWKKPFFLIISVCLGGLLMISGSRSTLVAPALNILFVLAERRRKPLRLKTLVAAGLALLLTGLALGALRARISDHSKTASSESSFVDDFLYGNNYSDVRDFSWILSRWNGRQTHGMTFLAGMTGFLPRSVVPFREEWGWALYTNRFLGLTEDVHPGLRPGPFGEVYLGFGIPGVIVLAIILGLIVGDMRVEMSRISRSKNESLIALAAQVGPTRLYNVLVISSGFFNYYIFLGLALSALILRKYVYSAPASARPATEMPILQPMVR